MVPDPPTLLTRLVDQLATVIVGKRDRLEDAVVCLMAGGHLLIEDIPGVGKTTLAQALAVSLGLDFARVQFTADLMPADLTGVPAMPKAPTSNCRGVVARKFTRT